MPRGGKLSKEAQLFVVQGLARWETLLEVAAAVKEVYGIEVSKQAVHHYHPQVNPNLSEPLKAAFAGERKRFIAEVESHSIAHQSYRIQELAKIYRSTRSPALQLQALEQAAREMGGAFTNRREVGVEPLGDLAIIIRPDGGKEEG
jgi:hypothetical protein